MGIFSSWRRASVWLAGDHEPRRAEAYVDGPWVHMRTADGVGCRSLPMHRVVEIVWLDEDDLR